jgi:heme-degrading monooxygenase HmoA
MSPESSTCSGNSNMFASTFIFRPGQYDDAFHALDQAIAEVARAIPGYLGEEAWQSADGKLVQNIYYWSTEEAMMQLVSHPTHIEAKQQQAKWLDGYRVVISKVQYQYGDGKLPWLTDDKTPSEGGSPAMG